MDRSKTVWEYANGRIVVQQEIHVGETWEDNALNIFVVVRRDNKKGFEIKFLNRDQIRPYAYIQCAWTGWKKLAP